MVFDVHSLPNLLFLKSTNRMLHTSGRSNDLKHWWCSGSSDLGLMWLYTKNAADAWQHSQAGCWLVSVLPAGHCLWSNIKFWTSVQLYWSRLDSNIAAPQNGLTWQCHCIECHHAPVARVPDEGSLLSVWFINMLTAIVTMHPCTWYMKIQIQRLPDRSTS